MWTLPANNSRHDAEFRPPAGTIRLVLHRTDTDHGRAISRRADFSGVPHGVEFTRALGDTPWRSREFVVKDCDGRLLAFGADQD